MKSKSERLEGTDFDCINNCCKDLFALVLIIKQCRYMNNEMLRVIANQIEDSASSIQYNCLEYLDLLEGGGIK